MGMVKIQVFVLLLIEQCFDIRTQSSGEPQICASDSCSVCWDEAKIADDETLFVLRPDLYGCDYSRSLDLMNLTILTMPFMSPSGIPHGIPTDHHFPEEFRGTFDEETNALERTHPGWVERLVNERAELCNGARVSGGNCHAGLLRSYLRGLISASAHFRLNPTISFTVESGIDSARAVDEPKRVGEPATAASAVVWVMCDEEALRQVSIPNCLQRAMRPALLRYCPRVVASPLHLAIPVRSFGTHCTTASYPSLASDRSPGHRPRARPQPARAPPWASPRLPSHGRP